MSVSPDRTPESIARDIQRKLIDVAKAELPLYLARIKEQDNYLEAKMNLVKELATITGSKINDRPHHADAIYTLSIRAQVDGYADIRVNPGNSVDFTFHSVSKNTALKLAAFLKSLNQ